MFEVRVSGGYAPTIETDLTDVIGSLDGATVKGALVTEGAQWPGQADAAWQPANVTGTAGQRVVSQVVPSGAVGHFWWWLWLQVGGSTVVILVMDPDDPDEPWLIYAH